MTAIDLALDGDNAWTDLQRKRHEILHLRDEVWRLAVLSGGMTSGKPSIALRFDYEKESVQGTTVLVAETSLATLIAAVCAIRGRYPEAFAGTPLQEPGPSTATRE